MEKKSTARPLSGEDELVPLGRIEKELGWTTNTVRRYLASTSRLVDVVLDPQDNRKKLYPLQHTVEVLRREHCRIQARRERSKDEGGGYWTALARLKVAAGQLRHLSGDLAEAASDLAATFAALRRRPPLVVEITSLLDPGLDLLHPLTVIVAPLRLVFWRATLPDIPLRGEASLPEEAIADLKSKLAERFRQLREAPSSEPDLWQMLSEYIRVKRPRRKHGTELIHEVASGSDGQGGTP